MRDSRSFGIVTRLMTVLCLVSLCNTFVFAQARQDYSKPKSAFTIAGPYVGRSVAPPNFANAPRLDQLLRDGKLYVSMNDAIAMALENNLDLAIARYNLDIADTDILRAKSGGSTRGINTGIVQGTPGGTSSSTGSQGGGAGGTTTGAGGAGTGSGGIVSSTSGVGSSIDSFDPVLTGSLQLQNAYSLQSSSFVSGTNVLQTHNTAANFGYSQGFISGTALGVSFQNSRSSSSPFLRPGFNPSISSGFRATLRQHLTQGFGFGPNTRFIRQSKNNREISDLSFKLQVITTVTQIQNIYWDLVNAYEDARVKERSLALAQKTFEDNKKQVEIGTLAPIEVVRAQSEVATRNQDLIISQTNLQLQQLFLKNAVTRNLSDPVLAAAPVIPTDTMVMPAQEEVRPVQDLVEQAFGARPDIASQRIDLKNRSINKKSARNALLPSLDLSAWYGGTGLAGDVTSCDANGVCATVPGVGRGYGGAFGDLFDSTAPDKGVALSLNIPIRNRAAQADQVRSELEYRQAEMRLQQLQNQINIEVRNSQFAVQQNRARVDAAKVAQRLAQESLDAEQKKYALGASTNTLVLQAQRDLTQAEVNLVAAMAAYEKSRVDLDRVTGFTLNRLGINIDDAETGKVKNMPNVPYVGPRTDVQVPPAQQNQTQLQQQQPQK